jgi:CMP-N-acetylneuraminic acid synthetase
MNHLAVIPARMGSVGVPHKNRIFFDLTADFIDSLSWFDGTIVTTNDPVLKEKAKTCGYRIHDRPKELTGPDVSIKSVFVDLIESLALGAEDILWLFYIPLLYRDRIHFDDARKIIQSNNTGSLCSFIKAQTHPFNCWHFNETDKTLKQYIPNEVFRRQDLSPAWMHYHYICCFRANEISSMNHELINSQTTPLFLDDQTASNLIEIDTPEDLERWKLKTGKD